MPKRDPHVTVKYKNKLYSGEELAAARINGIINPNEASRNTLVYANGHSEGSPTELKGEKLQVAIEKRTVITRGAYNKRNQDIQQKKSAPKHKTSHIVSIRYKDKLYYGHSLEAAIKNKTVPKDKIYFSTLVQATGENSGEPTHLRGEELKNAWRSSKVITRAAYKKRQRTATANIPEVEELALSEAKRSKHGIDGFNAEDHLFFEINGLVNVDICDEPLTPHIDDILESVIELPASLPEDNFKIPALNSFSSLPTLAVSDSVFGLFHSRPNSPAFDRNDFEISPYSIDLKQ